MLGIFRRQTIWLRPWGYLQQVRRLQTPPGEVYPDNPCGFSTGCPKLLKRRRGCLEKLGRSLRVCLYYYCFPDHNHKTFQQFARLWFPRGAGTFTPRAHSGKKLRKAAMESVHCKYQSTLMGNYTTPTLNPTSQPQPQSQPLNLNPNPNLSTSTPTSHLNPNLSTSTPTQTSQPQPQPLNLNPTLTSQPQTQPQPLNLNPHPNLSTSNPTPTSQLQPPPQPLNLKPNPNLST